MLSELTKVADESLRISLNPCYNGRCSRSPKPYFLPIAPNCLNPCYNGRCSRSAKFADYYISINYDKQKSENPRNNHKKVLIFWGRKGSDISRITQ